MTELLERAFQAARDLPASRQDMIARLVLDLSRGEDEPVELSPDEEASLTRSFDQAARGEFATEAEVRAVWAKHGL